MELDWSQCAAVESIPGKVGDAWVFRGTRTPVPTVFDNLGEGMTIDELVKMYGGLTRDQVRAVLEFAARSLEAPTGSAGAPRVLFQTGIVAPFFLTFQYDVSPDGRFLINSFPSNYSPPLTLLTGWTALLKGP